jgi:ribonuclease HI
LIVVHVDGLCEPINPGGTATFGYLITDDSGGVVTRKSGIIGKGPAMSSNVAEYAALCEALEFLLTRKQEDSVIEVRSDSTLVVNQMRGKWRSRKGLYRAKYLEAVRLCARFAKLGFRWIPREENEEADGLSREAYVSSLLASPKRRGD